MIPAPPRALEQRITALAEANRIRTARAALKRDLKAGTVRIGPLILDPPPDIHTAKVLDLLRATPKIGNVKAAKILKRADLSPSKTFRGMTLGQRARLINTLGPHSGLTNRPTQH